MLCHKRVGNMENEQFDVDIKLAALALTIMLILVVCL